MFQRMKEHSLAVRTTDGLTFSFDLQHYQHHFLQVSCCPYVFSKGRATILYRKCENIKEVLDI